MAHKKRSPRLLVTRGEDDDSWQFLDGEPDFEVDAVVCGNERDRGGGFDRRAHDRS
jgi:hypothetical protein